MINKMNKKGDLPTTLLVFMVVFLVGFSLYKFSTFGADQGNSIGDVAFLESVYAKEKMVSYNLYHGVRQAVIESYNEIANEGRMFGDRNPLLSGEKTILQEFNFGGIDNLFNEKVISKKSFFNNPDKNEAKILISSENFNFSLNDQRFSEALAVKSKKRYLILNFIPTSVKSEELKVNIGVLYSPEIEIEIDLRKLGLEEFSKIYAESRRCSKEKDFRECLSDVLSNFDVTVEEKEEFFELRLKSKKAFLLGGDIKKVEFGFLVKKT